MAEAEPRLDWTTMRFKESRLNYVDSSYHLLVAEYLESDFVNSYLNLLILLWKHASNCVAKIIVFLIHLLLSDVQVEGLVSVIVLLKFYFLLLLLNQARIYKL
jgi:hypothetical protein